jgi:hypothetical protein
MPHRITASRMALPGNHFAASPTFAGHPFEQGDQGAIASKIP